MLSAQRLLRLGLCDAVLCGGVDTLCKLAINGFHALEAIDDKRCDPFSRNRHGINIGEAAAVFLMTRELAPVQFLGGGASSDAYHMSAPDPQGIGAQQAMQAALRHAQLDAAQIDYINLHGTATEHNDSMESQAVAAIFPHAIACSSTKSLTGHTLGAGRRTGSCFLLVKPGRCAKRTARATTYMGWRSRSYATGVSLYRHKQPPVDTSTTLRDEQLVCVRRQ